MDSVGGGKKEAEFQLTFGADVPGIVYVEKGIGSWRYDGPAISCVGCGKLISSNGDGPGTIAGVVGSGFCSLAGGIVGGVARLVGAVVVAAVVVVGARPIVVWVFFEVIVALRVCMRNHLH